METQSHKRYGRMITARPILAVFLLALLLIAGMVTLVSLQSGSSAARPAPQNPHAG